MRWNFDKKRIIAILLILCLTYLSIMIADKYQVIITQESSAFESETETVKEPMTDEPTTEMPTTEEKVEETTEATTQESTEETTKAPTEASPSSAMAWDGNLPESSEEEKLADALSRTEEEETFIVVSKWSKTLYLYQGDQQIFTAPVLVGMIEGWDKEYQGDMRTPEGEYYICEKKGSAKFYRDLSLSYPGVKDAERGYAAGQISEFQKNSIVRSIGRGERPSWDTALGGAIMIHGENPDKLVYTAGCVEVTNDAIDILWEHCSLGDRVFIYR